MICKKCGFNMDENTTICPFCGQDQTKEKEQFIYKKEEIKKEEVRKEVVKDTYTPISKKETKEIRNSCGYVNLKINPALHLVIAGAGYALMYVFFYIFAFLILRIYKNSGIDFSCIDSSAEDIYQACAINVKNAYVMTSAIAQVVAELLVVAIIAILFRKYIKTFFNALKDRKTWKYYGIGMAILYGGVLLYSWIITILNLESTSSNQDAVNEVIYTNFLFGFLFVVIAAPLFEELIFRFGIFRFFASKSKKMQIIGIIVTTIIFASIHMVSTVEEVFADPNNINYELLKSDLLSLPIYLIGAFGLTFTYYKSKNLISNILVHMTYNFISLMAIFMSNQLGSEAISVLIKGFSSIFHLF